MWQNSNQKVRALAVARKRDRDRARLAVHFKRISATVETVTEQQKDAHGQESGRKSLIEARVVLNDFSTKGVSFFSPTLLPQGLPIVLSTHAPLGIVLHGRVVYCQEANATSHVISAIHFGYRVGMEFTPETEAEKESLSKYCQDLKQTFLTPRG